MTHWKSLMDCDFLGVYSFEDGKDKLVTIQKVTREVVTGAGGRKEECPIIYFNESNIKPLIMNSTNAKTISKILGTPDTEKWIGGQIQIYPDFTVKFGGEVTGGVRVRPFLPKKETYTCSDCGKNIISAFGLTAEEITKRNHKKYGKPLCADCAIKAKEAAENALKEGDPLNENDENSD